MKILILTQPLEENYGGILQNYALQTVLKRRNHDVQTLNVSRYIDRQKYLLTGKRLLSLIKQILLRAIGKNKSKNLIQWFTEREKANCYSEISRFIQNNIVLTEKIVFLNQLRRFTRYDGYIVGSDQVWRNEYSPHQPTFFLNFLPSGTKSKKIAYAASFGKDIPDFTSPQIAKYKVLLNKFDAVSVRELPALDVCSNFFDTRAEIVPDPTMLLTQDDYRQLAAPFRNCAQGKVAAYILDMTPQKKQIIQTFAEKHHLEVVWLKGSLTKQECLDSPGLKKEAVEYWLGAINSAEYIFTDSFHGTVFSLLFEKEFFVFSNAERGHARFATLDHFLNIRERIIDPLDTCLSIPLRKLDYSVINKNLATYRESGYKFLKNSGL